MTIHNFVFRMRHNCNSQPPKMHYQWGNPHTSCIRLVPDIWDKVKWGDAVLFRVPYLCQTRVDGWETGCACYVEPPSWGRDAVWLPGATGQKVRERGDAVRGAVPTKRHDLSGFGQVCWAIKTQAISTPHCSHSIKYTIEHTCPNPLKSCLLVVTAPRTASPRSLTF